MIYYLKLFHQFSQNGHTASKITIADCLCGYGGVVKHIFYFDIVSSVHISVWSMLSTLYLYLLLKV